MKKNALFRYKSQISKKHLREPGRLLFNAHSVIMPMKGQQNGTERYQKRT
jgi:hypothetical protein